MNLLGGLRQVTPSEPQLPGGEVLELLYLTVDVK